MRSLCVLALGAVLAQAPSPSAQTRRASSTPRQPKSAAQKRAAPFDEAALQRQVMLDRAGFSPGVIDGHGGANTDRAFAAFQHQGTHTVAPADALTRYRITPEDAAGPFVAIPADMMEKATLPALGYVSLIEALSERFHTTPALLQVLNPGITFGPDQEIQVPNVDPMLLPVPPPPRPAAQKPAAGAAPAPSAPASPQPGSAAQKSEVVVTVSKAAKTLIATTVDGAVVFYAPVTTGSEHDPLPIGEWKVNGVQRNPAFHYNPSLFWDADPSHDKARLPAGPNNPVGLVWIDISKEHYGLHGTPVPEAIGRSESHGCVRLTNWDALRLAGMVKPGTRVVFTE